MTALSPMSSLSGLEAQAEWEKAIHILRRDGARPRDVSSFINTKTRPILIYTQDRERLGHGDVSGKLPFRLHYCAYTPRKFPGDPGTVIR